MSFSKISEACGHMQDIASRYTDLKSKEIVEEFIENVNELALSIISMMNNPPSTLNKKAKVLAKELTRFQIIFSSSQLTVLEGSEKELLRQTAKILEVEKLIDTKFPPDLPGCNVIIMSKGEVLAHYSAGLGNKEKRIKSSIHLPQHLGSISKQFTAACIVDLEIKGVIKFTDDIYKFFPSLPPFTYLGKKVTITVDNLLNMQSGLPEVLALAFISGKEEQDLEEAEKLAPLFVTESIDLAFLPGTKGHYCNTNYYLLAEVVKIASGMDLKTYAKKYLFTPFGMDKTHFIDPEKPTEIQSIPGYATDPDSKVTTIITTRNKTSGPCGGIAPPLDIVKWDANCLLEIWNQLTEPPQKLGSERVYARGLWVEQYGKLKIARHSGGIEGFQTEFLKIEHSDPSRAFTVFLSSNNPHAVSFEWLVDTIASIWAGEEIFGPRTFSLSPDSPKIKSAVSQEELTVFEGKYTCPMLKTEYLIEAISKKGHWFLKLKPVGAEEQFSFHFAPLENDPHILVHVKDNDEVGSTKLQFFEDGHFIFSDPDPAITKLRFKPLTET